MLHHRGNSRCKVSRVDVHDVFRLLIGGRTDCICHFVSRCPFEDMNGCQHHARNHFLVVFAPQCISMRESPCLLNESCVLLGCSLRNKDKVCHVDIGKGWRFRKETKRTKHYLRKQSSIRTWGSQTLYLSIPSLSKILLRGVRPVPTSMYVRFYNRPKR